MADYTREEIRALEKYNVFVGGTYTSDPSYNVGHIKIDRTRNTKTYVRRGSEYGFSSRYKTVDANYNMESTSETVQGRICAYVSDLSVDESSQTLPIEFIGQDVPNVHCMNIDLIVKFKATPTQTATFTPSSVGYTGITSQQAYNPKEPTVTTEEENTYNLFSSITVSPYTSSQVYLMSRHELNIHGIPFFADETSAIDYINTGNVNMDALLNDGEPPQRVKKFINTTTLLRLGLNDPKTEINDTRFECEVEEGYEDSVWGYKDGVNPYSIQLDYSDASKIYRHRFYYNGEWTTWTLGAPSKSSWLMKNYTWWQEEHNELYGYVSAKVEKNIKIFANSSKQDELDNDPSEDGNESDGEPVDNNEDDIKNRMIGGVFTSLYTGSYGNIRAIARAFWSPNESIWEEILKVWKWYGDNPLNWVVRQYYTPIDITPFCTLNEPTDYVWFGNYQLDIDSTVSKIGLTGKVVDVARGNVVGTYKDYRDDMYCNFAVYLPYVGVVPLNKSIYLNKVLSVKATYDLYTHTLKYYMFSDGKFIESHETSLGVDLPVIGTDYAQKLQQDIKGITSVATGIASTVTGASALSSLASVKTGLDVADSTSKQLAMGNVASGVSSIADGLASLHTKEETIRSGNLSSSTAIHDINYPYLIIETQKTIKPSSTLYGLPDNDINTIGSRTGYVKVTDVKLNTKATVEERNLIMSALNDGIYV